MVPPRNATSVVPSIGSRPRWLLEVADDRVDPHARVLARPARVRPSRSTGSHTSNGHDALERAGVGEARRAAGASWSTCPSRARGACWRRCARAIAVGLALEDLGLAAGRVVLGEPGDLVEQLRAALVVEPLRRQVLRRRR